MYKHKYPNIEFDEKYVYNNEYLCRLCGKMPEDCHKPCISADEFKVVLKNLKEIKELSRKIFLFDLVFSNVYGRLTNLRMDRFLRVHKKEGFGKNPSLKKREMIKILTNTFLQFGNIAKNDFPKGGTYSKSWIEIPFLFALHRYQGISAVRRYFLYVRVLHRQHYNKVLRLEIPQQWGIDKPSAMNIAEKYIESKYATKEIYFKPL